ncbi:hypothetical protein [Streptomyces sp. NPDC059828]|uniref:hypothetical protein n=1 Tax=Streptomyces sp. NPDC059828 TaxID=3346965 RepID=UPI0036673038
MTISHIGVGALSQAATSITPAFPAGATTGRLAILVVVSGHPTESIPTTPSGWSSAGSFSGGTGSFGSGTGPRRLSLFTRVLLGSDTAPTTQLPTGTGSLIAGRIHVLSRSAGTGWRWATAFGEDTTSGTGFSGASASPLTWAAGDFALLGYALSASTASATAEAVTASGITFGTVTEQADDSLTTGNAGRLVDATGTVSSGSGTQAPTVTATLGAAAAGVAGVLRIREATAAISATAQTVFPPRILCSVTGMLAEDIVEATIYRVVGTTRTPVRAASDVDVTGQAALLRVDAEQPFGVSTSYAADLTDSAGGSWTVTSGSITSTVSADVISDAVRGVGAAVTIRSWPDKKRTREAAVFNVGGRLVSVARPRSSAQATVGVSTASEADGDALQEVLDGATEGVILIRGQTTLAGVDGHLAALSDSEDRAWYNPRREWALDIFETEPWPDVLEAAGFTLQDIADNYATLLDLSNAYATLLAIAQADLGV